MEHEEHALNYGTHTFRFMDEYEAQSKIDEWVDLLAIRYKKSLHFVEVNHYNLTLGEGTHPGGGVTVFYFRDKQMGIATIVRDSRNFSLLTIVNNIIKNIDND